MDGFQIAIHPRIKKLSPRTSGRGLIFTINVESYPTAKQTDKIAKPTKSDSRPVLKSARNSRVLSSARTAKWWLTADAISDAVKTDPSALVK
jgi:hypothetical protein